MSLTAYCAKCNKLGHWACDCKEITSSVTEKAVTNKPVTNTVTNIPVTNVTNKVVTNIEVTEGDVNRVLAWREKNRDKYKAYQREYMRKRREANRVG